MTVLLIDDNSLVPLITLAFVAVVITSEKITMVTTPCRITSGDHPNVCHNAEKCQNTISRILTNTVS